MGLTGKKTQTLYTTEEKSYLKHLRHGSDATASLAQIFQDYPELRNVKKQFDAADTSGNCKVEKSEFVKNSKLLFPEANEKFLKNNAEYIFDSIDKNKNGAIEWNEFVMYALENKFIDLKKESLSGASKVKIKCPAHIRESK